MYEGDPDQWPNFEEQVPTLRVAVVRVDDTWCLGLGSDALPDDGGDTDTPIDLTPDYEATAAHYLCERPRPDPGDFVGMAMGSAAGG